MRLSRKRHLYLSNYFEFMASLSFSRDGQTACPGADRVSDVHRGFSRSSGYFNVSFGNAGIKRRLQQNADVERCQQPANANFERFQRQNADIQRYQQQNESSCVGDVGDRKSHRRRVDSWGQADVRLKQLKRCRCISLLVNVDSLKNTFFHHHCFVCRYFFLLGILV